MVQTKLSSLYKIEVNVDNGETYASIMDSVEAFYWDKDLKTISLQRVPYNNGKFVFELEDTIKSQKLKTIVEYYSSEQIGESAVINDRGATGGDLLVGDGRFAAVRLPTSGQRLQLRLASHRP